MLRRRIVAAIAGAEFRRWWRERTLPGVIAVALLLVATSLYVTIERNARLEEQQQRNARAAEADWQAQPDRHPHRVVHFGDYVFKPPSALAAIDWGVESHTGRSLFLEGHRQNTANFSEASQSGALLRFGQLTPANVALNLLPLLLIFLGFATVAGEREAGTLRLLLTQGASGREVVAGKWLAMLGVAAVALLPLLAATAWTALVDPALRWRAMAMFLTHAAYLALWSGAVVLVSAWTRKSYAALVGLLALWVVWCVLLPRALPSLSALAHPIPTRVESEMRAERALKQIGDSHDPNDPHFAEFRARTLRRYGVDRVEDLPVNYGGLLMIEGERLTSEVYARETAIAHGLMEAQNRTSAHGAWISPAIAAATVSRAFAATDFAHHRHFVDHAERRRYDTIQALNRLHAEKIRYRNDRDQRLHADHWDAIPREPYRFPDVAFAAERSLRPALALLCWIALVGALLVWRGRRLEREA